MKRLAFAAVVVTALMFGTGTAVASGSGATKDSFPVSFVLTSASCPNLPSGTSINGSGTMTSITRVTTDANGVTTIRNSSHAHGSATDGDGNAYVFNYSNKFRVSNTLADPAVFSGRMTDSFSLAGRGPARLHNGFVAVFTTNADFNESSFHFVPLRSHGDPIKFDDPWAQRCDPL